MLSRHFGSKCSRVQSVKKGEIEKDPSNSQLKGQEKLN